MAVSLQNMHAVNVHRDTDMHKAVQQLNHHGLQVLAHFLSSWHIKVQIMHGLFPSPPPPTPPLPLLLLHVPSGPPASCPASVTVKNTGNMPMQFDSPNSTLVLSDGAPCSSQALDPSGSVTCLFTYTYTQPDKEQGSVMLNLAVTGSPVDSADAGVTYGDSVTLDVIQDPKMTLSLTEVQPQVDAQIHSNNGESG